MRTSRASSRPQECIIGSPAEVLKIAPDAPWPAPFVEAARTLSGVRGCSHDEAEEALTGGTLYALPLVIAARHEFVAQAEIHNADLAARYIDFQRYALDCLAEGQMIEFQVGERRYVAAPAAHH